MRLRLLTTVLRWLAVVLVLRVVVAIVANYSDYFPPDFDSLFLQGRERTFTGVYRVAFYAHIASGPVVLVNGLVLLSATVLRRAPRLHRRLGWVQVTLALGVLLPSGVVMAQHSYAGWPAGISFLALSVATAGCLIAGVRHARHRRIARHRRWMLRSTILIGSAVSLRLISGAAGLFGVADPESAYVIAAWSSWLVPLAVYELVACRPAYTRDRFHAPPANRAT